MGRKSKKEPPKPEVNKVDAEFAYNLIDSYRKENELLKERIKELEKLLTSTPQP